MTNVERVQSSSPTRRTVTVGKIPGGQIHDVEVDGAVVTVRALFQRIGVQSLAGCELQRNGTVVDEDTVVQPGDMVLAVTKICGNL